MREFIGKFEECLFHRSIVLYLRVAYPQKFARNKLKRDSRLKFELFAPISANIFERDTLEVLRRKSLKMSKKHVEMWNPSIAGIKLIPF